MANEHDQEHQDRIDLPPAPPPPPPPPAAPAPPPPPPPPDPWASLWSQFGFDPATGMFSGQGVDPTTGLPASGGTSNVIDKMLSAYSQDIPFLRNPDIEGTSQGQAIKESMATGIRANYDAQRETLKAMGAQQGAGMSGVVAEGLTRLDEQEAADLSNIDRQFLSQYTSNLGQSRAALTDLANMEQQRNLQGLQLLQGLYGQQGQGLSDLMNILYPGLQTGAGAPGTAAGIGQGAAYQAAAANQEAAYANQGLQQAMQYWAMLNRTQPTSPPPPSSAGFYVPPFNPYPGQP